MLRQRDLDRRVTVVQRFTAFRYDDLTFRCT